MNYDGKHKYHTTIGDRSFIGSNTKIIAPVTIGKEALTAAGSTITDDIPDHAMGIARSRQTVKPDFGSERLCSKSSVNKISRFTHRVIKIFILMTHV
ncbi:Bifunctional protein GlmU [Weissella viridescens]|uniref:Bifunctional protein GlmU n=1 Tax=Weissella viridescens TaxID=1629 RepID=A0A380P6T0_WEIVI|nr:Bifunctional protein GlmU [Weissella viridescens]